MKVKKSNCNMLLGRSKRIEIKHVLSRELLIWAVSFDGIFVLTIILRDIIDVTASFDDITGRYYATGYATKNACQLMSPLGQLINEEAILIFIEKVMLRN